MPHLDLSNEDDTACEIEVDRTAYLSHVLMIHPSITIQMDSHQAFILMKKLTELFNCELIENEHA